MLGYMGCIARWSEDMRARFSAGTFGRIVPLLADGEDRTEFVRIAVDCEIERRERAVRKVASSRRED